MAKTPWPIRIGRGRARPCVLAFVDLVQDIDVLLPVLLAFRAQGEYTVRVRVSRWLAEESPRTAALLRAHGLDFGYVRRRDVIAGTAPSLRGIGAVIAASESSHPAHAAAYALAARAKSAGLKTYALQHGLENIGLFGLEVGAAVFESDTVFCWFPQGSIPADLPPATRGKLAHAGRPDPPGGWRGVGEPEFDLGVFENLHWDRYTDADRANFRAGVMAVARAMPASRILLRAHPAGGWADQLGHELARFTNITAPCAREANPVFGRGENRQGRVDVASGRGQGGGKTGQYGVERDR